MGRVNIEEAAAVRPEHFDSDLRSSRAEGQNLLAGVAGRLQQCRCLRTMQCLHYTLRYQHQRQYKGQWQQDIEYASSQINPEIAYSLSGVPREAAYQGYQHSHAAGGREKVMYSKAHHLAKVAHGDLAAVILPVGVSIEADSRVEGQSGADRPKMLRVERQDTLKTQHGIER